METIASCCLNNNPPSIFEPLGTNTIPQATSYTKIVQSATYVYSISNYNKYSSSSSSSPAVATQAYPTSKPHFGEHHHHFSSAQYDHILQHNSQSLSSNYLPQVPNSNVNTIFNSNTKIVANELVNPTMTKAQSLFDLRRSSSVKLADVDADADDGSVASKLLPSISKSLSSPSLLACCKESVRETPYQKALKLKAMNLHHCAEELGSESSEILSPQSVSSSASSIASFDEYDKHFTQTPSLNQHNQPCAHDNLNITKMRSVRSLPSLSSYNTASSFQSSPKRPTLTRVKSFPPPLSHTLPESTLWSTDAYNTDSFSVSLCSYREHGRFILKEVRVPTRQHFTARRSNGRLTLHIVTRDDKPQHCDNDNDNEYDSPKDVSYLNNHAINEELEERREQSESLKVDESSEQLAKAMIDEETSTSTSTMTSNNDSLESQNCEPNGNQLHDGNQLVGCGNEQESCEFLIATLEAHDKSLSNLEPDVRNGNISKLIAVKVRNQNSLVDRCKLTEYILPGEKRRSSFAEPGVAIADAIVQAGSAGINGYSNDMLDDRTSMIWAAGSNEFNPNTVGYASGLPIPTSVSTTAFVQINDVNRQVMDVIYMLISLVNSGNWTCQESWHTDNNCNNCFGCPSIGKGNINIKAEVRSSGCGRNILNYDIMKISAVQSSTADKKQRFHYNNYAIQSIGKEQSTLHNYLHCKELNFDTRLQHFNVAGIKAGGYVAIHS